MPSQIRERFHSSIRALAAAFDYQTQAHREGQTVATSVATAGESVLDALLGDRG